MSKKEVKNLLKAGKPKTVVKTFRREATEYLKDFLTDKDPDIQKNAIIAYGVVGDKLGITRKQTEPFFKSLDKFTNAQTFDIVVDTIFKMGDKGISPLINKLADRKSSSVEKALYSDILKSVGEDALVETILSEKITSPTVALRNEIILRLNTSLLSSSKITAYDPKFQYDDTQIKEYRQIIKKALSSDDSDQRYRALAASESYPTITKEFAGEIAQLLGTESEDMQKKVLQTLGELGNPVVIPAITKLLTLPSEDLRLAAVKSIGSIRDYSGVTPLLKHSLLDANEFVRQAAVNALGAIGQPAAEALVDLLDDDQYVTQIEIALKRIGEPAVRPLTQAMAHKNKVIRKNASELAKMILTTKYGFEGTVLKLIDLLRDRDTEVQDQVIETIINMGDPALEAVIKSMATQDTSIRNNSRDILDQYALMNIQLVVENRFKQNLIAGVELVVLLSVYSITDEIKDYAISILEGLEENQEFVSAQNAIVTAVINNILLTNNAFSDPDDDVRYSLAQIGLYLGTPILEHLITFLSDKNLEIVEVALDSLGYLGSIADIAIEKISSLTRHKNIAISKSAIAAFGNIGHPDAVPVLIESMGHAETEIQDAASEALDTLGEAGIPALLDSLAHKNPTTRSNLVQYIKRYGQAVHHPLIERLTFDNQNFQEAAAFLIGELGDNFGTVLLSEVQLIPNNSAQLVAVKGFGYLQYRQALPYFMDILRKKDKKLTNAVLSTQDSFKEYLARQCLDELEHGGETMEKIIKDFVKSVNVKYLIAPILEQMNRQTPKKDDLVGMMQKISDKDVNAKLISLLDTNQLAIAQDLIKIIESEPKLSKLAGKVGSTVPR